MFLGANRPRRTLGRRDMFGRPHGLRGLGDDVFGFADDSALLVADPVVVSVDPAAITEVTAPDIQGFGGSTYDPGGAASPASNTQTPATPAAAADSTLFDQITQLFTKGAAAVTAYKKSTSPAAAAPAARAVMVRPAASTLPAALRQAAPMLIGSGILALVISSLRKR
jgi:hypothetical protein